MMFNKIILTQIKQQTHLTINAMISDDFEKPENYKGWIYPFRYLLALRYLKLKQTVLTRFREQKIYPISGNDFKQALIEKLSNKKSFQPQSTSRKAPILSLGFKSWLVYPALLTALLFGLYSLNDWHQQRKIENILANHLPYYTDLLHRKLLLTHNQGSSSFLKKIDTVIVKEQEKILMDLPKNNGIRESIRIQLEKLKDASTTSEEIMLGFKEVNTLFDQQDLPYYLSPKTFSLPCSSLIDAPVEELMMLKQLESLMSNNNPELCRTTMMTTYKVSKRNQLFYDNPDNADHKKTELPLFHVTRIDKVPAVDSALGLTFKERGIGSIILTERIKSFGRESILPALTFQGRNYVIPYWMQGYYEIEEAVTKGYKKDLKKIYPNKAERLKIKSATKQLIKNKNRLQNAKFEQTLARTAGNNDRSIFGNGFDAISVLLGKENAKNNKKKSKIITLAKADQKLLDKLDRVLLPSIEYHEAYHQIDKKDWATPAWVQATFKDENLSDNGLDHTMEELGAYLAQLASTDEGHNIWFSKLLIFSLSPFTQGQAEHYASSIILTTMESIYLGEEVVPYFKTNIDNKTKIYNTLINLNSRAKKTLAAKAYKVLFEREAPLLTR